MQTSHIWSRTANHDNHYAERFKTNCLISNTLTALSSDTFIQSMFFPHKTTGKIAYRISSVFVFIDKRRERRRF
jgi:hypothetical protein